MVEEFKALLGKCKKKGTRFVCEFEKLTPNYREETYDKSLVKVEAREIPIHGCGGISAEVTPGSVKFRESEFFSEEKIKELFAEDPWETAQSFGFDVKVEKDRLKLSSQEEYPCE